MKKKVLFLLEAFDKGGIEKVTLDIVNNLSPEKYDITVQTFWYGGYCQSLVNDNVKVIPFFAKKYIPGVIRLIQYLTPKMLYKFFVHGKYDIEIAASDGGAAKVISGSSNKKAKKICWVHMDVINRGSKLPEFDNAETAKNIYEKFDLIVPVSQSCAEGFCEKFGNEYPISVKYNPLPVKEIIEKSRKEINMKQTDDIKFVCVGRLVEQKGFDRLIEACNRLLKDGINNFYINILGSGPLENELSSLINKYKLNDNINLYGYCDNPYAILYNSDAFLLSSRDEAFPLVVGESLIVGTPIIATDCCGVKEWLGNNEFGLIVENSENGIYEGMKTILENPEILKEYKSRIPEAQKNISFEKALNDFEEILR